MNKHDVHANEHEQVATHQPHQLSLLAGLEEGKLPYTTEVHLVEVVNGVKKTYLATIIVTSKPPFSFLVYKPEQENIWSLSGEKLINISLTHLFRSSSRE